MARGPRVRIATGIYRDRHGLAVIANVGQQTKERRFPHGTTLPDLKREQHQLRTDLLDGDDRPAPGTLAAGAKKYLKLVAYLARSTWRGRKCEIKAWVAYCGPTPLRTITKETVLKARNHWLKKQVASKTINNRVGALRHLYHTLGTSETRTPCDDVPALGTVQQPPEPIDAAIVTTTAQTLIQRVKAKDEDATTLARFLVLTATGVRPSELGRAEPGDVHLGRGFWRVRTGKGGFRTPMPLNADMVAAWTFFLGADAWGPFDVSDYDKKLYAAGWPRAIPPYQARHTFGWELSDAGVSLDDIQLLMGHKDARTTRTHYVGPIVQRLAKATQTVNHRLGWAALKLPRVPGSRARISGTPTPKTARTGLNSPDSKHAKSG